jgi:hypothetical protein
MTVGVVSIVIRSTKKHHNELERAELESKRKLCLTPKVPPAHTPLSP